MDFKKLFPFLPIIIVAIFAFILGWLFPVEGPYDYVYDNYASQPANKRPNLLVVPDVQQGVILFTELSLDDLEMLEKEYTKSRGISE